MYKKIYLIHIDGYPLTNKLIEFSKKNNFEIFPQITNGIFTMPSLIGMMTGKNSNKNRINGLFYSMKSRQMNSKYIMIYELLSKYNFDIYGRKAKCSKCDKSQLWCHMPYCMKTYFSFEPNKYINNNK